MTAHRAVARARHLIYADARVEQGALGHYAWPQGGDEWSVAWGGSEYVWFAVLLPRLLRFVPAGTGCWRSPPASGAGRST